MVQIYSILLWTVKLGKTNWACDGGGGWLLWYNWDQWHVDENLKSAVDLVQTTSTLAMEFMEA